MPTETQMPKTVKASELVVFKDYDEAQIARAGEYAVGTVVNVKAYSADKISRAFKIRVSAGLGRSMETLFAVAEAA